MQYSLYTVHPRYDVQIIDHENNRVGIGLVEPAETKYVNIGSLYDSCKNNVCEKCDKHKKTNNHVEELCNSFQQMFLTFPEMFVEMLDAEMMTCLFVRIEDVHLIYYNLGLLTIEQLVMKLYKYPADYADFVQRITRVRPFREKMLYYANKQRQHYDLCRGYDYEGSCKLNMEIFRKKLHECSHETLMWVIYPYWSSEFFVYDLYLQRSLSLPNVYESGKICFGSGNNPEPNNLESAKNLYWEAPFDNQDLLWDGYGWIREMIEEYGLDPYDYEDDDGGLDDVCLTPEDFLTIISNGGGNCKKSREIVYTTICHFKGAQKVLHLRHTERYPELEPLVELAEDLGTDDDLFIYLINEIETDVWEAYLPTDYDNGEFLNIDLTQLANLEVKDVVTV